MVIIPIRLRLALLFTLICAKMSAQTANCPPNIDFGMGNFMGWECRMGEVYNNGGINTLVMSVTSPLPSHHTLLPPTTTTLDPYGSFPQKCPYTDGYTVKLGNASGYHEAEGLSYTYTIPSTMNNFSLLFYYAVVLEDPGHLTPEQPRFRARVIDVNTFQELSCVNFDFIAGSLPGFQNINGVMVKDWTPISVDLSGFAGKTIRLEFITSDCTYVEHFGYAYISVAPICNGSISGGYICNDNTQVTIKAPLGYQAYAWYSDPGFTQVIHAGTELTMNVNTTAIGDVYPVIVTPFPGFGCQDTFYATIQAAPKPVVDAGPDLVYCNYESVQIGSPPYPTYTYDWSPANHLSDPKIASPFIQPRLEQTTDYIIKATDLTTGCIAYDTATVRPLVVDTSSTVIGDMVYCPGEPIQTTLQLSNTTAQVQWYYNNWQLLDNSSAVLQPQKTGIYRALLSQFGCIDTSRIFNIELAPYPEAAFMAQKEVQCINNAIRFVNNTTVEGNTPVNYTWEFSDGSSMGAMDAVKTFSNPGPQWVRLIATTGSDCKDTAQQQITIMERCATLIPNAFTPNNDGLNDKLKAFAPGVRQFKRFSIYNRWGVLVFSTTRETEGWDGTHNGVNQPTGVYVWSLEYVNVEGRNVVEKGTVTLIR